MELMLVCHGSPMEYSTFELPRGFCLWYIGTPGKPLPVSIAMDIVNALKNDPTHPERVAKFYGQKVEKIEGPQPATGPNFELAGDDVLPAQEYNFITRQEIRLKNNWRSRLGTVVGEMSNKDPKLNNLFLLCCWEVRRAEDNA